jgi:hypothetical protein
MEIYIRFKTLITEVFIVTNAEKTFCAKRLTALKNKNLPKSYHLAKKKKHLLLVSA